MAETTDVKLDLFVEVSKAQTAAVVEQTRVLHEIKTLLKSQHDEAKSHNMKLTDTEKTLSAKLSSLEFASKIHWFIVGGGFLGIIGSIVAVLKH